MENKVDLKTFLKTLRKRTPLIASVTLLAVLLTAILSYTVLTPTYEASTQILVNEKPANARDFSSLNIDTNIQLISTYNVIIKSPVILSQVIEELGLAETPEALSERITVSNVEESQVVTVNVQDPSLQQAVQIANTTATIFEREVQELMNIDNVEIIAFAKILPETQPVKPDPFLNMAIAAVIGFMAGTALAIIVEQLNTTVRTEQDIEEIFGTQALGIVMPFEMEKATDAPPADTKRKEIEVNEEKETFTPAGSPKIGGSF